MFVTLTANPSVDRTVEVDRLNRGGLHRASGASVQPGGKGINVARALVRNGLKARAVVPAGGAEGDQLISLLEDYNIDVVRVRTEESVRSNISVVEPDATVTKVNEIGPHLTGREIETLCDVLLANVADAEWVVAAGSLPPGVNEDFYAELIARLAPSGVRVVVDTSGPAFRTSVKAGPALVKPNLDELEEAVDRQLDTVRDVVDAAQELRSLGAGTVLASLGSKGAVLVEDAGIWCANASAEPRSSVGAGDAMLAGFLAAGGSGPQALATAVAWGAAAVSLPGSTMPGPEDVGARRVRVDPHPGWDEKIRE
ncbi:MULTISPECIES: 1-phosphofructokinase [unclassified Amycolatopsis]|uniref:1-phosphofructokinase n=1 Tax=unclassified Amycolatopsis TaxID=2618356 RepID=UPI001FF352DA|nr:MULTISPECIES: 1-phosphofructokinase [unclassified Amycolatopsis]UOZ04255.1 1-phosphofructokinase [Amycolatopsis sp. WQ 127309]WSJ79745.1 1-phosphofructokinase [Amycolatopsis sp. NBC_01307]WSK84130.1 1-phosphofructokinase [Amycolatopsis sp. NBC_01286]